MPITDLEVGPDGNVYLTTGGAAGQGGLYRVSWTGAKPAQPDMTGILAVVRQPQPLSSWGWDAIERVKATMGAAIWRGAREARAQRVGGAADRVRAVLEMQRHGRAPGADLLQSAAQGSGGRRPRGGRLRGGRAERATPRRQSRPRR